MRSSSGFESLLIVFSAFALISLATLISPVLRQRSLRRGRMDWWIDFIGLFSQGVLVPLAQVLFGLLLGKVFLPSAAGSWDPPYLLAFALVFFGVDYLYYWNHRLLHRENFWRIHALHHSASILDIWATSRNTLWTPLFIVYLWVNGLLVYLSHDPSPILIAAGLTSALDLWRHSSICFKQGGHLHRVLSWVLITPHEHEWHHSRDVYDINFGANISWWDRMHGTYRRSNQAPDAVGSQTEENPFRLLFALPKRGSQ